MTAPCRIGVVGGGSMGRLHARVIASSDHTQLAWVADPDDVAAKRVADVYGARALRSPEYTSVDAVVVASPTETHTELAFEVLDAGKPLLLEKPAADDLRAVETLVQRFEADGVPLMCGLLERFNPAVRTAFSITRDPVQLFSVRHSPYVDRIKTGVAWDLLIHDVDLALRLFEQTPEAVRAVASYAHPGSVAGSEDTIGLLYSNADGTMASLSASRISQRKIRGLTIVEVDRLIEIDLIRQDITIHRHLGLDYADVDGLGYQQQSIIEVPVVRFLGEPLALQLERFVDIVAGRIDADEERRSIVPAHAVVDAALVSARA